MMYSPCISWQLSPPGNVLVKIMCATLLKIGWREADNISPSDEIWTSPFCQKAVGLPLGHVLFTFCVRIPRYMAAYRIAQIQPYTYSKKKTGGFSTNTNKHDSHISPSASSKLKHSLEISWFNKLTHGIVMYS